MLNAYRRTLRLLEPRERRTYYVLIVIKIFSSFLDLLGIATIGLLVGLATSSFTGGKPVSVLGLTLPKMETETLLGLAGAALVLFIGKGTLGVVLSQRMSRFLATVDARNARKITEFFARGSLLNILGHSRATLNWAVIESTTLAFSGTLLSVATIVSESSLLLFIAVMFFAVDPIATAFTVGYFALLLGVMEQIVGRISQRTGVAYAQGVKQTSSALSDLGDSFREITVLERQDYFIERVAKARWEVARGFGAMKLLQTMPRYIVETALMVGVVAFVGWQFVAGDLANGGALIGIFLAGGVRIMGSALPLQNALAAVKSQIGQSETAHDILEEIDAERATVDPIEPSMITTPLDATRFEATPFEATPESGQPSHAALGVRLHSVDFAYPDAEGLTLQGVSLEVKPGQHGAFIGPSGAGKTTLVDLILGLLPPTNGHITFSGRGENLPQTGGSRSVAYVPQKPGLVEGTLAENIALGVPPAMIDFARIDEVLALAVLRDFVANLPEGINTSVGPSLSALSGGQLQRLGLARALYVRPQLLVLDEATSALDAGSESVISQSLSDLGEDVTVIVVAHRLSTVQHLENVFVLDGGRVIAEGPFQELRKTVPLVEEYVSLMSFDDE